MGKGRLEAFSDGVIAIIITIMVLELRAPAAFVHPWISCGVYAFVALMWLVPNPRVEKLLGEKPS
jgi:uncharacterized membrane protein